MASTTDCKDADKDGRDEELEKNGEGERGVRSRSRGAGRRTYSANKSC